MDLIAARSTPERRGKPSFWSTRPGAGKNLGPSTLPGSTQPPEVGVDVPDRVRGAFWQSYRHLFPAHALAVQTPSGGLVISWSIADDPNARYPYAAPVMLRFDETLLALMAKADARQRARIAQNHEPTLREGLRGYDPFSRFPNARVINIG